MNKHSTNPPSPADSPLGDVPENNNHVNTAATTPMEYISNPFTSSFKGLEIIFRTNQTAAIIIVAFEIVGAILQLVGNVIQALLDSSQQANAQSFGGSAPETGALVAIIVIVFIGVTIVLIISAIFQVIFKGIINYVTLCSMYGKKASWGEGFSLISKRFTKLLIAEALITLKVIGGFLLFVVPGVRATLRYRLVYMTILDRDMSGTAAMDYQKNVTKNKLMELLGVSTVAGIIPIIGSLVAMGGNLVQYKQLTYTYDNKIARPATHWLNYLGIVLIGILVLFIVAIAIIFIAVSQTWGV